MRGGAAHGEVGLGGALRAVAGGVLEVEECEVVTLPDAVLLQSERHLSAVLAHERDIGDVQLEVEQAEGAARGADVRIGRATGSGLRADHGAERDLDNVGFVVATGGNERGGEEQGSEESGRRTDHDDDRLQVAHRGAPLKGNPGCRKPDPGEVLGTRLLRG